MANSVVNSNLEIGFQDEADWSASWAKLEYGKYSLTYPVGKYLNVRTTAGTIEFLEKQQIDRRSVAVFRGTTEAGTYGQGAQLVEIIYSDIFVDLNNTSPGPIFNITVDPVTGRVSSTQPCVAAVIVAHREEVSFYNYEPQLEAMTTGRGGLPAGGYKQTYGALVAWNQADRVIATFNTEAEPINREEPIMWEMYRVCSGYVIEEDGPFSGPVPRYSSEVKQIMEDNDKAVLVTEDVHEIGYLTDKYAANFINETYSAPTRAKHPDLLTLYNGSVPNYYVKWSSKPTGNQDLLDMWNKVYPGLWGMLQARYPGIIDNNTTARR